MSWMGVKPLTGYQPNLKPERKTFPLVSLQETLSFPRHTLLMDICKPVHPPPHPPDQQRRDPPVVGESLVQQTS